MWWRARDENREVTVVGIKISGRSLVGLDEVIIAREQITALFFFHFHNRALQFRQEIENLSGLSCPFLIVHALVEHDLLFVLQRLQDFAGLIEQRIAEGEGTSGACLGGTGGSAFAAPRVQFRSRNRVEPLLDDLLNFHDALALFRAVENQCRQVFDPALN